MIPQKFYFLTDIESIIKEINLVKATQPYSLSEIYFSFTYENSVLVFVDLEKNEDLWNPKTNFLNYSNEEDDEKIRLLFSLWNSGYPTKVLPPILDWNSNNSLFTILDGFNRARLYSNAFAGDDKEGEMLFLFKKEIYNALRKELKQRIQVII